MVGLGTLELYLDLFSSPEIAIDHTNLVVFSSIWLNFLTKPISNSKFLDRSCYSYRQQCFSFNYSTADIPLDTLHFTTNYSVDCLITYSYFQYNIALFYYLYLI